MRDRQVSQLIDNDRSFTSLYEFDLFGVVNDRRSVSIDSLHYFNNIILYLIEYSQEDMYKMFILL